MITDRAMVRHAVATVAYRGSKTLRHAPRDFASFRVAPASRSPVEIVAHMGDLFDWALTMAAGKEAWREAAPRGWEEEVARFYASVKALDVYLESAPQIACSLDRLFQGPIADALTHVGQLAMLRHLLGSPISGENYFRADIVIGQVGPLQAAPTKEFD